MGNKKKLISGLMGPKYHCAVSMENDSLKFQYKLGIDTDRLLDVRDEGVGRSKYCLFRLFRKITF